EGGGDAFEPDLRHLVDAERQYVRREAVAVPGEGIDQRATMGLVVKQQNRGSATRLAIDGEQRAQFAQQRVGRRQGITPGAGRTGRGALATAGADLRVDRDVIAVRYDRTRRTEIEAAVAADDPRPRMDAKIGIEGDVARLVEASDEVAGAQHGSEH